MTEEPLPETIMDGTVESVRRFLEVKINKNELSDASGSPMLTAAKRIISIGDDVPSMPVRDLDLDALFIRFRNRYGAQLTDQSAQAYQSRFRRAHGMYLKWLDGEPWNTGSRQRAGSTNRDGKQKRQALLHSQLAALRAKSESDDQAESPAGPDDSEANAGSPAPLKDNNSDSPVLFEYPVLLDSGLTAVLRLPARYNRDDATRMKALLDALARNEPPATNK